jgi:hypothetical protein
VEEKPAKFRVALIWARLLESKDSAPRTQGMAARLCLSVTGTTVLGDGLGKVKEVLTVEHGRDNHFWLPPVQTRTGAD